jgi:hypothetical protein
MALLLAVGGCLVNDSEFDQALSLKESLTAELSQLRQSNDQLNRELGRLYSDREILSGHVALTAALALYNRMTDKIRPAPAPAPVKPAPAKPARPAQAAPPPAALPPVPPGLGFQSRPGGAVDWGQ